MYIKGYELGTEYIGLRNYYLINAVIPSVAVFIFCKNINYSSLSSITINIISKLSSYSFGVYLLHIFVMLCIYNEKNNIREMDIPIVNAYYENI